MLEFNQHLDKIEAWIRDKEMMVRYFIKLCGFEPYYVVTNVDCRVQVQAHELGRDYEHCSALLRKLDDLDSDMKVDDKRVKALVALADKLLQKVTLCLNLWYVFTRIYCLYLFNVKKRDKK